MKTILKLTAALFLISGFAACFNNPMTAVYDSDIKIAGPSNTYNLTNIDQSIDGQNYICNVERFEGMDTIWTYEAPADETSELNCLISVSSGKLKLVLIEPDNTLTTIVELTAETEQENSQTFPLNLKKGENRIKVVTGADTQFDMELSVPVGTLHNLG